MSKDDPTCESVSFGTVKQRPYFVDLEAVDMFAELMMEKLRRNRHKAHWKHVDKTWLLGRLKDELKELEEAMEAGDSLSLVYECADVANFAMMIANNAWIEDGVL